MPFFHLDRNNTLKAGQTINHTIFNDVTPRYLQEHVDMLFPNGISSHGEFYIIQNGSSTDPQATMIELLFEYVRRGCFADKPSRYEAFFAFETLKDLSAFIARYKISTGTVWEVECNNVFKGDMNLLALYHSSLVFSYNAHCYWQGLPSSSPLWELLLTPPVYVAKQLYGLE